MSASTIAPLTELALRGAGIAFLPPFAVAVADGRLVPVLADDVYQSGEMRRYGRRAVSSRQESERSWISWLIAWIWTGDERPLLRKRERHPMSAMG